MTVCAIIFGVPTQSTKIIIISQIKLIIDLMLLMIEIYKEFIVKNSTLPRIRKFKLQTHKDSFYSKRKIRFKLDLLVSIRRDFVISMMMVGILNISA